MSIDICTFGKTLDNNTAHLFIIANENGLSAKITDFGAILVSLLVPDRNGQTEDVVLGFDTLEKYFTNDCCYFGSTVGRNSNRVKNASFVLNNKQYSLDKNERENNLHSGFNPYNKRLWDYEINNLDNSITFSLISPDGDQGFPGNFNIKVTYKLSNDNEFIISYNGISDKDTIANMTNHSYFNLSGHTSCEKAMDQTLWINSNYFVEVDNELIPTGILKSVKNTPMDFTNPKAIGKDINNTFKQFDFTGGYDHSYLIDKEHDGIEKIAILKDIDSGRTMEVYSDAIGVQFYAGNFIENNKQIGKNNCVYSNRSGICLETGFLPDSMNQCNFISPILRKNEKYETTTIYKFV